MKSKAKLTPLMPLMVIRRSGDDALRGTDGEGVLVAGDGGQAYGEVNSGMLWKEAA